MLRTSESLLETDNGCSKQGSCLKTGHSYQDQNSPD